MKKSIFYLASAALAAGLAACSSDELENASSYTLEEGEFAASIQDATSTRTSIDGTNLRWTAGDEIGLYSDEGKGNYEYGLKTNTSGATGVFKRTDTRKETFTAAYAYYPYDADNTKTLDGDILGLTLADEIQWEQATVSTNKYTEVKMPMVGKVSGSNINFQNVTGLIKITVVGMPSTVTAARLTNKDGDAIAGAAKFDLTTLGGSTQPALYMSPKATKSTITYCANKSTSSTTFASAFSGVSTFDFYYIVPAGTYDALQFSLGTDNTFDDEDATKTFTTKNLKVEANKLYYKTLRYATADGSYKLVDGELAQLNDDLEAGGELSYDADLSAESGTIYIPAGNATDEITLNLTLGAYNATSGSKTITITTTDKTKQTPKVIINANQLSADANTGADLAIDLPLSAVTINAAAAPAENRTDATPTVNIAKLVANTYEDVLYIAKGVTVSDLTLQGTANAYAQDGATVTKLTGVAAATNYLFYETASDVSDVRGSNLSDASIGAMTLYQMYYPKTGSTIDVDDSSKTLARTIKITAGKTVTLDLHDLDLTAPSAKSAIEVDGGTLEIKNSGSDATKAVKGNSSAPAIVVSNGGTVTFSGATISNSSYDAVKVTGKSATKSSSFTLTTGTITGNLISEDDGKIETKDETTVITGAVTVAGETTIKAANITGNVTVNKGTVSITTATGAIGGTLTVSGGDATIVSETAITGAVTVSKGKANITAKTTFGAGITVSDGEATVEAKGTGIEAGSATITGVVSVTGGKLTLTDGRATTASTVSAGTFIMNGGSIITTTGSALKVTGGTVTIQGASKLSTSASSSYALELEATNDINATIQGTAEVSVTTTATNAISVKGVTDKALNLNIDGTAVVKSEVGEAIVEGTSGAAAVINIKGGSVSTTAKSKDAIALTNGSTLNVSGGTIAGTASAVKVTKGSLNIASGSPVLSATDDVILIGTEAAAGDAKVTLSAADAKYTGANVLKDANSSNLPTLSISEGQFTGDVTSTKAEYFISGGHFKLCQNLRTNYIQYLKEGKKLQYNTKTEFYDVVAE